MKKIIFPISFLLLSLCLISCEDYVDIDIPSQEKKIAAYCFLSPQDTLIRVWVFESMPLFGTTSDQPSDAVVQNATVTLSNGNNTVTIPYNTTELKYQLHASQFPIEAGVTYRLSIEIPGLSGVHSETTVPTNTPQFSSYVLTDYPGANGNTGSKRFLLNMKWQDFFQETNYYSIKIQNTYHQQVTGQPDYYQSFPVYQQYFKDEGRDGTTIQSTADIETWLYESGENNIEKNFVAYLLNCSKDYYLFHLSVENGSSGDDPFSEPTLTYSNIVNGLGCFASFNGSSVVIPYQ